MTEKTTITTEAGQNEVAGLNNSTQHYDVLMQLGDCLASVGKYDQAKQHYEKAALLDPDAAGPYVGMGVVAMQNDSKDDADLAFRVACRLDPNCARAYAGLAMLAQHKSDFAGAFNLYLKCLEIENDNLTALLGLFQTSCQMGSFEKINYYLKTYLDLHPGDTSVMFALSALYMKDGRLDESQKLLTDILALRPDYKEAANLLEEVEQQIAQREKTGNRC